MTLSYNVGLTGGSLVAYLLDAMLGPPIPNPCYMTRNVKSISPRTKYVSTSTTTTTPATTIPLLLTTLSTLLTTNNTSHVLQATTTQLFNLTTAIPTNAAFNATMAEM
jgi:solute carrier family 29 (equilibrative nucleoside transporter) protein 4